MRRSFVIVVTLLALGAVTGCGSEEKGKAGAVTDAVEDQLAYLEPESSLALTLDLRYEEENWDRLRPLVSRVLGEVRDAAEPEDRLQVPANADGALAQLSAFAGLDFDDDVRPLLDGHLASAWLLSHRTSRAGPTLAPRWSIEPAAASCAPWLRSCSREGHSGPWLATTTCSSWRTGWRSRATTRSWPPRAPSS